ncbi:ras GTPase-activating protein-binding protein 1 [Cimex lectularius]|uniref:Rasputin n=1 Tax=Cimex lectularius TaxID=79782 RepID=A0A8I6RT12_CIMLE|nr:ras GTPase-activating protein-binding protein 1 [Cimex lectularius]
MVTERPLSPQYIGREFVRQYYTLLNEAPSHLHRFYNNNSSFIHGGLDSHNRETVAVIGQRNIHQRIKQLSFRDCHTKITQVDSQATLGDGVVVQVSGEISNDGLPMRRFNQTFVLAPQTPKKYYVHNDIFRYQDMLTDEEIEGDIARSEVDNDQETEGQQNDIHQPEAPQGPAVGYYSAGMNQVVNGTSETIHEEPTPAVPVPQPEPPIQTQILMNQMEMMQQPVTTQEPAPQPQPLNQTPYIVNDIQQNQIEQEEQQQQYHNQINQQPAPTQPPMDTGNEPKTYATLVKSGGVIANSGPVFYKNNAPLMMTSLPTTVSPPPVDNAKVDTRQNFPMHNKPPVQNVEQRNNMNNGPRPQNSDDNGNYGGADGDRRRSNQYSDRNAQYSDSHQLFIGNLPAGQSEEQFKVFFARNFGPVVNVKILQKNNKKDYGFVTFEDASTVQAVLNAKPIKYPDDSGEEINVEEKKRRVGGGGEGGGGRGGPRGGGGVMRPVMGGGNGQRAGGPPGRGMRPFNSNRR